MAENLVFDYITRYKGADKYTAFDIGANVGKFTPLLARKFKSVVAFEPQVNTFMTLRSKVGGFRNVKCEQLAIADKNEMIKLYVQGATGANRGGNTIAHRVAGKAKWGHNKGNFVTVQGVTIDSYVADHNITNLRLMKVDVEGAEDFIFNGAVETIKNTPQLDILLETHQTVRCEPLTTFFRDLGCRIFLGNKPGSQFLMEEVRETATLKHDQHYLIVNYDVRKQFEHIDDLCQPVQNGRA